MSARYHLTLKHEVIAKTIFNVILKMEIPEI